MGYYIEVPEHYAKAEQLQSIYNAEPFQGSFSEVPKGKTLVCVVSNPLFDAAAICYDENEFRAFHEPGDFRPKRWLTMKTADVIKACPRVEDVLQTD